jgi:hypothetical protein
MQENEIRLGEVPQHLFDELIVNISPYQVALLGVAHLGTEPTITYVGSGVLVRRRDIAYILTAGHVWDEIARFKEIGLGIKETFHDTRIDRDEVAPHVAYNRADTDWGPDIAFLELSVRAIDAIGTKKRYYLLDPGAEHQAVPKPDETAGVIAVVGAPTAASSIGRQTAALHAGPWIGGIEQSHERNGFDYFDIGVDAGELPFSFGGISGGPAWQLFLHRSHPGDPLVWKAPPQLIGIVLSQSEPAGGRRIVRCHGPRAIYIEGPRSVGVV